MANKKITQLPTSTTPLTGSELLPVVQSSATVQTSVNSLGPGIGYTPAGTGVVATTVQTKLRESVSVKDFGAKGDGVTDDTAAFVLFAAALVANNVAGYIPSGRYILKSIITFTSQVSLYGDAGVTQLIWPSSAVSAGFAIYLTSTRPSQYVYVNGLTFIRDGARASGTALYIDGSAQIFASFIQPRNYARVILNSIVVAGSLVSTSSWAVGININSVIGAKLSEIDIVGSFTTSAANLDACTGLLLNGSGSPVEATAVGLRIYTTEYAVDILGWEGVYLIAPTLVQVETGVRWQTGTGSTKPHLLIQGGHIASQLYGVNAIQLSQGDIQNVLFYSRGVPEAQAGATHIVLNNGLFNRVGNCTFAGTTHDGIVCTGTEQGTYVYPSIFQSANNAIQLNSSSNYIIVDKQNFFGVSTIITNLGIANAIPDSNAIVRINAVQSIPNTTFTKISFTNANNLSAPEYWNIANPTRMVAPRGGFYEIKCAITFATNATGFRQVRLLRGGVVITAPQTLMTAAAVTGAGTVLNATFSEVNIGIGDYVEIEVNQNSGGNLDIAANSWAQINMVKV